ncbi:hypothetical protein [Marinobacter sp.]|uniref:hypothetical protein n=1 Tax=Marinobacter sp. TaxID=50741 RepID=UPI00356A1A84
MIARIILLWGLALPLTLAADPFTFEGTASDRNGDFLYTERHQVTGSCESGQWRPEQQQVAYVRDGDAGPFATKTLAYTGSLLRPEVDFRQPEFSERLVVRQAGDELSAEWTMADETAGNWRIPVTGRLVVDAGFDHLIRASWSRLTAGDSVRFSILAPTRGESYDFIAEPAPEPLEGADYSFRIRPQGMIMRVLVDPIRLGYSDEGFLTHYAGLGNIRRNQDENHTVTIRYRVVDAPDCALLAPDQQG